MSDQVDDTDVRPRNGAELVQLAKRLSVARRWQEWTEEDDRIARQQMEFHARERGWRPRQDLNVSDEYKAGGDSLDGSGTHGLA